MKSDVGCELENASTFGYRCTLETGDCGAQVASECSYGHTERRSCDGYPRFLSHLHFIHSNVWGGESEHEKRLLFQATRENNFSCSFHARAEPAPVLCRESSGESCGVGLGPVR